ncbi:MAG TPA: glycosyltransferase [Pantanalinema sp.]
MLRDHDLVCLSITPWETRLPSSGHYLMREFARHNRVLWVDHPATLKDGWTFRRDPAWRDRLARTWGRQVGLRRVPDPQREVWVLTPPPMVPSGLPRPLYDWGLEASAALVRRCIRRAMQRLEMREPIFWVSFDVPLGERLAGTLGERMTVYHCFDEITGEPYIARHGARLERALMDKSEVVFTTSPALQASRGALHPRCHYVPNGVDYAHYARAGDPREAVPEELARLPGPVIGYLGNLEARFDYDLIQACAEARPGWSWVLVGPVQGAYAARIEALSRLPNVHVLGPCPAHRAPGTLKVFDVGLIPFVSSVQTRAIYPLKLNEYLAAGLPVVMTPFAALDEVASSCRVAEGAPAYLAAIERSLGEHSREHREARMALARAHDWSERALEMGRILVPRLIAQNARMLSGGTPR